MSKVEKDLAGMRQNATGWRYAKIARILEHFGFTPAGEGGSHRVFKHPSGLRVGVVDHGSGTVKPVYVKEAIKAIDQVRGES
jgi:predicted RNA binding protein YcfA (HicA-like mRNA interferase family)